MHANVAYPINGRARSDQQRWSPGPDRARPAPHSGNQDSALTSSWPQLNWSTGADGLTLFCNDRWRDFTGRAVPPGPARWTAILHPDEQAAAWAQWQQHVASGEAYEAEHQLRGRDGHDRWALARALPVHGSDGRVTGWGGSLADIHRLKCRAAQLDIQASELNHRMHNIFAVVESLLMLSSREEPHALAFARDACDRIHMLARANDYIGPPHGTDGAPVPPTTLHGLLETLLAPYQPAGGAFSTLHPISVVGPAIAIGPSAAIPLALALHELATNALKHGALGCAGGRLSVATSLADGVVRLVWTETGGPALDGPPARQGFGSLLIDRALRLPLGAQVAHVWGESGLTVSIAIRHDRLLS